MKPAIDKRRCPAYASVCTAIKNCAAGAISYVEDENELLGGKIIIDYDKCRGCGMCVKVCCGSAIVLE